MVANHEASGGQPAPPVYEHLLGFFSFLFHAAHVGAWQQWDVGFTSNAAVCLLGGSCCLFCLQHIPLCVRRPRAT